MDNLKISAKVGGIPQTVSQILNAEIVPLLHQAVRAVAQQTQQNWQESVLRAKLWSGEKDPYAASIKWEMTGAYSAVVSTDYKSAAEIETGRPARDLKKMLDTSTKVRRTKDGRRFLVIPFRHNVSSMPPAVKSMAAKMTMSRVMAQGMRPSGEVTHLSPKTGMRAAAGQSPYLSSIASKSAAMVPKRIYEWGARMKGGDLAGAGLDAVQAKKFKGMVRMNTSTPGGAKSSAYMTFRIMMEGSAGWVVPAQPGQFIAKKVVDDMQPKAEAAFAEAIKQTLKG